MRIKDQITKDSWVKGNLYYSGSLNIQMKVQQAIINRDISTDPYGRFSACRNADSCCLEGWLYRIYEPKERDALYEKVLDYINELGFPYISTFNDHPTTTYEDVEKLVQELDI